MTSLPIVCLGSSAGGLSALIAFFKRMAPASGYAFVVIQHLKADVPTMTPDILSRTTTMPVSEAIEGEAVLADHVYTLPSNTRLTIAADRLHLAPRTETPGVHKPFDRFLESLATNSRTYATAVVLSGYDGDGSIGFVAIKANGGTTYAQDWTALVDEMPKHAMQTGCVDHVLDPGEIADHISQGAEYAARAG